MTDSSPLPSFLTTDDVLGYLRVTPRTIYRLIRDGELPAVRIGRQWRFRRSDLDAWLERQRASSCVKSERPTVALRARAGRQAAGINSVNTEPTSARGGRYLEVER